MLRNEESQKAATMSAQKDVNASKGKAKKVAPPPAKPSTSKEDTAPRVSQKSGNPSASHNAPTPPTAPSVLNFNQEAISILREINTNQTRTNEKVEKLGQRVDELYAGQADFEAEALQTDNDMFGNADWNYFDYQNCQNDLFDDEEGSAPLSSHSQQAQSELGSPKRAAEEESVFASYLKKFKKSDTTDVEVNMQLADIVNNAFRDGMPDDVYNELVKGINRPVNCEALKKTRVNQGVWTILKLYTQTEDSKLRGVQNAVIKASINVTKMLNAEAKNFHDQKMLDWGTDAIGILGQANKWLDVRRKDLHKRDMDPKLHYLCSSALQSTDQLYGDSIIKDIKDAQEFNKISRQVGFGMRGRGMRGRSRSFYRGRLRGSFNQNRRRGSSYQGYQPGNPAVSKPHYAAGSKNSKPEHKK